jgi:hypothetical protein
LQHDPKLQQKLRWLTSPAAMFAIVSAGLLLFAIKPAFAEFQIQEAGIEKGEVVLEYRGAYHWGVPQVTDTNENANDVVQSHEIELQMGINDWFLIQVTSGFEQPLGDNLQASEVEIEAEFALLKQKSCVSLSASRQGKRSRLHCAWIVTSASGYLPSPEHLNVGVMGHQVARTAS